MEFTQLQVRSTYSLLQSTIQIESLVKHAKSLGLSSVSLVEIGSLHSSIKFYEACQKEQMKPIFGLSVVVSMEEIQDHWTLLAKNNEGYQVLLKCATQMAMDQSVSYAFIQAHQEHLIVIAQPSESYLYERALAQNEAQVQSFYDTYLKNLQSFYVGLCLTDDKSRHASNVLLKIANNLQLPVVALNDVRYLQQEDATALQHLRLIDQNLTVDYLDKEDTARYFKTEAQMRELFKSCPQAVDHISDIINQCEVTIPLHQTLLPKYQTPEDVSSSEYLKALCHKGLAKRYQGRLTQDHLKRLEYELEIIEKMGFSDYFLIVWDFVKFAKLQQINVGCGRGSAAGSIVSYVLGITNVDPIQYELLFERFLNPERVSMPDIDIDFQDTRRDEVIAYVANKYGKEQVVQIATFGTFQSRSAWRDVARLYEVESKLVNLVASNIVTGQTLQGSFEQSAKLQSLFEEYPRLHQIYRQAQHIEGLPRHTSVHAAGVIISQNSLTNYTALMKGPGDIYLSQLEAGDLEAIGLLKMDFLGLKNLSMLTQMEQLIQTQTPTFKIANIPFHDSKTFELIAAAQTTGVFQLESEGMKQALKLIRPNQLEDIIATNALFRPGPMENIPLFARRKHHQEPITYYHESLRPILEKTYGIIVYQEQIMQIANVVCGYSLGEADVLRRAVSKKKLDVLQQEREKFISKAVKNGYDGTIASQLYDLILKFANYGFNRSHAVAYSMIAYQMAYLKTHYPAYFMTVALSHSMGSEKTTALYVKEARKLGIQVLGPSVVHSIGNYTIENGHIRFGLLPIKNIGVTLVNQLVEERQKKPFDSYFDFINRCRAFMNVRAFECLIDSGACDVFELNRQSLHKNLHLILDFCKFNGGLFFEVFEIEPCEQTMDQNEIMQKEKELLGFYLETHPMKNISNMAAAKGWYVPSELQHVRASRVNCVGYVERMKEIRDKKGRLMCFCELSDDTETVNVTIFSDQYKPEYKTLLGKIIVIDGRLNTKNNEKSIVFNKIIAIT